MQYRYINKNVDKPKTDAKTFCSISILSQGGNVMKSLAYVTILKQNIFGVKIN